MNNNTTEEIWKEIVEFEGMYLVSNLGNVYSMKTKRIMKPYADKLGYKRLILRKDKKSLGRLIHRLVAEAFLDNPKCFPIINHKDEDPTNNHLSNLEWCDHRYNNNYGTARERGIANTDYVSIGKANQIPVAQYTLDGIYVKLWDTAQDIKRVLKFDNSSIARCCRGEIKTSYGYIWKYEERGVVSEGCQ